MTAAEKQESVEALRALLDQIEAASADDQHELLRLAALATYQIQRLTS